MSLDISCKIYGSDKTHHDRCVHCSTLLEEREVDSFQLDRRRFHSDVGKSANIDVLSSFPLSHLLLELHFCFHSPPRSIPQLGKHELRGKRSRIKYTLQKDHETVHHDRKALNRL